MRWLRPMTVVPLLLLLSGAVAESAAKIKKVLPQFLDRDGRHTVSPSLYDRDAYQARLRQHPEERSGLRFAVQWRPGGTSQLTLRVEMRGAHEKQQTTALLEGRVTYVAGFNAWSELALTGEDYKKFGDLVAWRATLWNGDVQVAEQKSFLW